MRGVVKSDQASSPLNYIPFTLVVVRAVLGLVAAAAAFNRLPAWFFFLLLVAGFLSDYFDGVVARRLGVATVGLRRADSIADTVFYLGICVAAFVLYPKEISAYWPGLALIVFLEVIRYAFDYWKFRRETAYHMWSAKFWGITLLAGFGQVFLSGEAGLLFAIAVVAGIVTDVEGLLASIVLREWRHDVPTLYHAISIARRGRMA